MFNSNWKKIRWAAAALICGAVLYAQTPGFETANAAELTKGAEKIQTLHNKSKRPAVKKQAPRKMARKTARGKQRTPKKHTQPVPHKKAIGSR